MKICLTIGCDRNVFSNLYCQSHQHLRTDDKWLNKARNKTAEPRSPIRRYKLPTSNEQGLKTTKKELVFSFGFDNQMDMFNQIWFERPHVCQLSGVDLNSVPYERYHWMFGHILPKGKYPFFKLNKDNILLLHPDVHGMVDNFTEDMITKHKNINFSFWFEQVQKQKELYSLFLRDNML